LNWRGLEGSADKSPLGVCEVVLNQLYEINDFSPDTIRRLAERIAETAQPEDLLYREAELDDLWRQVGTALDDAKAVVADPLTTSFLTELLALVHEVHDLVGSKNDPRRAAERLRTAL
jgi:hypothetical protein